MRRQQAAEVWLAHHESRTFAEMADMLGVTKSAFKNAVDRCRLTGELPTMTPSTRPPREQVLDSYLEGKAAGLSNQEIADNLGLTHSALRSRLARARMAGLLAPSDRAVPASPPRPRDEVLEDFSAIKDSVGSVAAAAERIGMSCDGLLKALRKARLAGDDRGVYAPLPVLRPRAPRGLDPFTRKAILEDWPTLREEGYDFKSAAKRLGRDRRTVSASVRWAIENGHPAGLLPIPKQQTRHTRRTA